MKSIFLLSLSFMNKTSSKQSITELLLTVMSHSLHSDNPTFDASDVS